MMGDANFKIGAAINTLNLILSCGKNASCNNSAQFFAFPDERIHSLMGQYFRVANSAQPETCFFEFLKYDTQFMNKVSPGFGAACLLIIGSR
jgi:hypothetical protein